MDIVVAGFSPVMEDKTFVFPHLCQIVNRYPLYNACVGKDCKFLDVSTKLYPIVSS